MRDELIEKLRIDFSDYLINDNEKYISFEVGDGWEPIIREAMSELKKNNCNVSFQQIKEKFGSIRMYYHTKNEESKLQKNYTKLQKLIFKLVRLVNHPFFKLKLYKICTFNYNVFWSVDRFFGLRVFRFKSYIAKNIICNAEYKSCFACQTCGSPAKIKSINNWMTCICEQCLIKRKLK